MSYPVYMLDTNIASYIIRDASALLRARLKEIPEEAICLSSITQGEFIYGLSLKPEATKLKKVVEMFLYRHEILPWDSDAARQYGVLRASLKQAGTPLSILDTMIAAHALANNVVLVTNDHAFSRIQGLTLEDWSKS